MGGDWRSDLEAWLAPFLTALRVTRSKEGKALEALHGEKTGAQVLANLVKWIDANGSLSTLPWIQTLWQDTVRCDLQGGA